MKKYRFVQRIFSRKHLRQICLCLYHTAFGVLLYAIGLLACSSFLPIPPTESWLLNGLYAAEPLASLFAIFVAASTGNSKAIAQPSALQASASAILYSLASVIGNLALQAFLLYQSVPIYWGDVFVGGALICALLGATVSVSPHASAVLAKCEILLFLSTITSAALTANELNSPMLMTRVLCGAGLAFAGACGDVILRNLLLRRAPLENIEQQAILSLFGGAMVPLAIIDPYKTLG